MLHTVQIIVARRTQNPFWKRYLQTLPLELQKSMSNWPTEILASIDSELVKDYVKNLRYNQSQIYDYLTKSANDSNFFFDFLTLWKIIKLNGKLGRNKGK